jgi:hypothetical protein
VYNNQTFASAVFKNTKYRPSSTKWKHVWAMDIIVFFVPLDYAQFDEVSFRVHPFQSHRARWAERPMKRP